MVTESLLLWARFWGSHCVRIRQRWPRQCRLHCRGTRDTEQVVSHTTRPERLSPLTGLPGRTRQREASASVREEEAPHLPGSPPSPRKRPISHKPQPAAWLGQWNVEQSSTRTADLLASSLRAVHDLHGCTSPPRANSSPVVCCSQNRCCFVRGPGSLVRSKAAEALRLPSPVSGAGTPQVAGHRMARPTQPADLNSPSVPSPTCKTNDKPQAPWAWRRSRCRCQLPTSWSRVPSVSSAGGGGGRRREKLRRPALQDRQSVGRKVSCVSPEMVP